MSFNLATMLRESAAAHPDKVLCHTYRDEDGYLFIVDRTKDLRA